jgi:hypothetical protein
MYQQQQGYSSSGRAMNRGYPQQQMGMAVGGPQSPYGQQGMVQQPPTSYPPQQPPTTYPPQQSPTTYPSQQSPTTYPSQQSPTTYPSQQQVVNNQTSPQVVQIVQQGAQEFGTKPVSMICQFCKKPTSTVVEKKCNCCACLCCFGTAFVGWFCIQCYRKKEFTCCDATHKCSECQKVLGNYTTC